MATVCVNIPDDQAARIAVAIVSGEGNDPASMSLPEMIPVVQDVVFRFLRRETLAYEAEQARQAVLTDKHDPLVDALVTATTAVQP